MKKNTMMRVASALLVAVLMTTCAISGTFAKYTTADDATDKARVAKWGVEVTAFDNSSFKTEYTNTEDTVTVKSSTEDKLVAPGTEDAEGVTFTISGTPEVATKATVEMTIMNDVFLKYTEDEEEKTYTPVVFTLSVKDANGGYSNYTEVASGTLADIEKFLEQTYTTNGVVNFGVNEVLDAEYKLTWAWEFESGKDALDTQLGDIAADTTAKQVTDDYSTKIEYTIKITIEQVD